MQGNNLFRLSAVRIWIFLLKLRSDAVNLRFSLFRRNAVFHAPDEGRKMGVTSRNVRGHQILQRLVVVDVRILNGEFEAGRHDAKNGITATGKINLFTDDRWITSERSLPQPVAQDHNEWPVHFIFLAGVGPSEHW